MSVLVITVTSHLVDILKVIAFIQNNQHDSFITKANII